MRLPYFPLHTVLFPHLPLPLHIFEDRYRAMTRDVLAAGSPYAGRFMVSLITDGAEVGGQQMGPPRSRAVGTIAEVRSADRLSDGRWVLLAVGVARARLEVVERGVEYAIAELTPLDEREGDTERAAGLLTEVQSALDAYLAVVKRFVRSTASRETNEREARDIATSLDRVLKPIRLPGDPAAASYAVAGVLQIELVRKQGLLELPDATARLAAELDLLRREVELLSSGALPSVTSGDLHYHPN